MRKIIFEGLESLKFAIKSLRTNLLRTSLSLLGVSIGIFSIVAIYSAIDAMNNTIMDSMNKFGQNTLYITKFSFMGNNTVPRWKRKNFPFPTVDEYKYLQQNLSPNEVKAITFRIFMPASTLRTPGKEPITGVEIIADGAEYPAIQELEFEKGRFFNKTDEKHGAPVIILGADIAQALFDNTDPTGKTVRLYGKKLKVIGVLKKEGEGVGPSNDGRVFIPHTFARTIVAPHQSFTAIIVAPKPDTNIKKLIDKISVLLRKKRKLKPGEINNFFVNNINTVKDQVEKITGVLKIGGGFLALFSLLIGAFGIANIMFVSVKERTNQIGIQKALGAKNSFILWQFLFESMFLSLIGGITGIFLVWLGTKIVSSLQTDFEIYLSWENIITGLIISSVIGIIAGLLPAWKAAKLDPVEAIRTGM
jgi:putative ABC transport system permease protein